jgi:LacI family transcriptional regulator
MGLLQAFETRGTRVPEQCRVIGIDNIEVSASTVPPLTTVFLAKEQLGARAVEVLKRRASQRHAIQEKIILSASLLVRQSG